MTGRQSALLVLLAFLLIGIIAWSWSWLASSRESAADAERDAVQCRKLADEIERLKERPAIAGSHEIELTELSKRIEQSASESHIALASLVRISPESPRRLDSADPGYASASLSTESLYLEKPTTVLLSDVTLGQLADFLYSMGTGPAAMDIRSLRLSAPREDDTNGRWAAEVTLSYLIYVPPEEAGEPRGSINGRPAGGAR